jgi:cyclic beta-1,2-glucan synthetase
MPEMGLVGILIGLFLGWTSYQEPRYGIEKKVLKDYSRWLVSDETVLVIRAPMDTLHDAITVLREGGDIPPAVFILHANAAIAFREMRNSGVPLSPVQIREHAERLAAEHHIAPKPQKSSELLSRLKVANRRIHDVCIELSQAGQLEQGTPATAEWLLDNEYVIESNTRDVLVNLPRKFYQQLPTLAGGHSPGLPRIYDLACEVIADLELRLDKENILVYNDAYQSIEPLSIGELWAIPQMLRIALIESVSKLALRAATELRERENADFWAYRLISANRRGSDQLFSILAEFTAEFPIPSPYFAAQLVDHLYDEESILVLVQGWLERTYHQPLSEFSLREQNRQAKDQISIGNAFTSLRQLDLLDWREIFESHSRVDHLLRGDASGVYPKMDFDTRDRYRRVIEELSRASGQSEEVVALHALALAKDAMSDSSSKDERREHVGTYLVGEGRQKLMSLLNCDANLRYRFLHWIYRHSSAVFFFSLGILTVGSTLLIAITGLGGHAFGIQFLLTLLLVFPVSQLVLEVMNYSATRFLPSRALPKMDFKVSGVPDQFRTLVVVPVLFGDEQSIQSEVEKLEVRYLANREDNLLFSLFTDYRDADAARSKDDARLLKKAIEDIESLNRRYGDGRFLLFHRERTWSESEQKFIGWERKRGKLEELNGLIAGTRPKEAPNLVHAGNGDTLTSVRFVITLDSDTQLPPGSARRMIETLAHPLNQPRFDEAGNLQAGSYTIIQPRVSSSLTSSNASLFSRLFADAMGIDPYARVVSDFYQDLTGEGSYYGKGIYDVRAFDRMLCGRFPEEHLLSHDLVEGAYVRVGLASDIELYDEFPRSYRGFTDRQHRWIRGDWQIVQWISSQVPGRMENPEQNPLSWFNRWKLLDNLRRSLMPAANLAILLVSWMISPQASWIATFVVAAQLFFRPLAQFFTMLTSQRGIKNVSLSDIAHDVLRALTDATLLPNQTALATDAILRTLYRRHFSHRKMLQWTSAQTLPGTGFDKVPVLILQMGLVSVASAVAAFMLSLWMPSSLANASPWLFIWFLSPLAAWLLNLSPGGPKHRLTLLPTDTKFLREISRRTWRYFDDFVNADTSWLPPDNYQVSPRNELALRTSPTNIGLWMLSALAAHDFGYLTIDEVVRRLTGTMETISGLEHFKGHLLNWYDVRARIPLEPRYVSTVDSGNLLGALWALVQGLDELLKQPIFNGSVFSGLQDTGRILQRIQGHGRVPNDRSRELTRLMKSLEIPSPQFVDMLKLLREGIGKIGPPSGSKLQSTDEEAEENYWATQIEQQISTWLNIADRYLVWMEILAEKSEQEISALGPRAMAAVQRDMSHAPSLFELANGKVDCIAILQEVHDTMPSLSGTLHEWLDRLLKEFSKSRWLAGEVLGRGERLINECRAFSEQINMRFLYDPERRLFTIGYNVSEGRQDVAFYDLLASESRLGSFVTIARGDISFDHWFSLSRTYTTLNHRRILLSWTGTMFEYLMPLLFQDSLANTLLEKASHGALAAQIDYGRKHQVPWGLSESAFADMDLNQIYQYRAFGVPGLGLRRESEEKIVISPYSTLLALGIAPREAVQNLKRLATLGLFDAHGYYEAIDFSRQPGRSGKRGVIIQMYMTHHQGMSLLSLTNFLLDGAIRKRFHADARVRSVEILLQERVPQLPPAHEISMHERVQSAQSVGAIAPSSSTFNTPHTQTPKTQLLSNGHYSLMVTNTGGGYSQWGTQEITRWRSDPTRDPWGTFFYIHEPESDETWSVTYQPVGRKKEGYYATFALDRAVFQHLNNGIQSRMEIVVSPEDDVEIRRVTLTNRSLHIRHFECSSYIELSMAPHAADRQHQAFNKLFIQTESLPQQHALLAFRRPREGDASRMYVAHRLTPETGGEEAMRFETDRRVFIGRGRSLANPLGNIEEPHNSIGYVLDPILSLRTTISLAPGQHVTVSLVLAAGETREQVVRLMGKYASPYAINRAMDFAWAAAQLELRVLHIQSDDARQFQQLASHLLYPNRLLRSSAEKIQENTRGQAGLWQYGISGDLPIALVTIGEIRNVGLVRQMLQAHTYWRMHGLMADLVILAEEASGYERPLHERLEDLIRAHSTNTGRDKPGGVFLRSADQIPEVDRTLLLAAASIVFVSARGALTRQVGVQGEAPDLQEKPSWKSAPQDPSSPLPFLELPYFNGLGGFTPDGREYAIYFDADTNTPSPWVNVIANPGFGTLVSERGSGFTWSGNSQQNRLTTWSNDPVVDPVSEALYIRDEKTGVFWTPTALPIREESAYRVRHGAGYSVFEHNSNGIDQELTVFVPMNQNGGQPIKLQRLRLKNTSSRSRTLSLTYYVEWVLGEHSETSRMHVVTAWNDEMQAITARNRFHPDYGERVAFAAIGLSADSYCCDRTSFLGRNGSLESAAAMNHAALSGKMGAGYDPCAALRVTFELAPGENTEITCMLGQAESQNTAHALVLAYRKPQAVEIALAETKEWWDDLLGMVEVHTPELATDFLINRWLLYQSLSCRIWGRSAFYQSGGAYGFRDQLQDVMALLYASPGLARDQIILAASRQFKEGDVQHWWHPPGGAGIRSRISDDLLWLPFVVAQYVRISGDAGILKTEIPFLDGPALKDYQHEAFFTPMVAVERASLFEHCRRSVARGLTEGPHGLPLMGTGDWNDGMNLVGSAGKGESVWLAWFLVDVLRGMSELSEVLGLTDSSKNYLQQREALIGKIERTAWDGKWYLRAFFDDGSLLGSSTNTEAKIDSLPQSWSFLSGGDSARSRMALESAWKELVREKEGLVLLFTPPFDTATPSPGYIQAYPPGVRENGGQYTHAALWLAMAMARSGDGTRAVKLLRMLNPVEQARDPEMVKRYSVEPYVAVADVYQLAGRIGQGGWSWYTGSAAWMYRAWLEEVLGLRVRGDRLMLDPVIPGWWNGFQVKYRHGKALYEIHVENPENCERGISWIEMDGQRLVDCVIPLEQGLAKHGILVRMGKPELTEST